MDSLNLPLVPPDDLPAFPMAMSKPGDLLFPKIHVETIDRYTLKVSMSVPEGAEHLASEFLNDALAVIFDYTRD